MQQTREGDESLVSCGFVPGQAIRVACQPMPAAVGQWGRGLECGAIKPTAKLGKLWRNEPYRPCCRSPGPSVPSFLISTRIKPPLSLRASFLQLLQLVPAPGTSSVAPISHGSGCCCHRWPCRGLHAPRRSQQEVVQQQEVCLRLVPLPHTHPLTVVPSQAHHSPCVAGSAVCFNLLFMAVMSSSRLRCQPHHFVNERFRRLSDELASVYEPVADILQQTAGWHPWSAERHSGVH